MSNSSEHTQAGFAWIGDASQPHFRREEQPEKPAATSCPECGKASCSYFESEMSTERYGDQRVFSIPGMKQYTPFTPAEPEKPQLQSRTPDDFMAAVLERLQQVHDDQAN